jgi:hypothetical protein
MRHYRRQRIAPCERGRNPLPPLYAGVLSAALARRWRDSAGRCGALACRRRRAEPQVRPVLVDELLTAAFDQRQLVDVAEWAVWLPVVDEGCGPGVAHALWLPGQRSGVSRMELDRSAVGGDRKEQGSQSGREPCVFRGDSRQADVETSPDQASQAAATSGIAAAFAESSAVVLKNGATEYAQRHSRSH